LSEADDAAPGWDAISAAMDGLYPGREPRHYGTIISRRLGGPDPLDGLSAWKRSEPVPHWHIVTYGFSELYEKESEDPALSGYGFELTFRPTCDPGEEEPPMWALNMLQNLARYVFETGNVFRDGDWMPANGPIARDTDTALTSLAFAADPEVAAIRAPFGEVRFLQVVGLTADEERAARAWKTARLLDALRPRLPLLVTDLSRGSLLADPAVAAAVAAGSAGDGSSTGHLFAGEVRWTARSRLLRPPAYEVVLDGVVEAAALLPLRLPFGRTLALVADQRVLFEPGERDGVGQADGALAIRLTPGAAAAVADALGRPGRTDVPGLPLTLIVKG